MSARLFVILSVIVSITDCVTVRLYKETPDVLSNSMVELNPILITSGLNDIVVLSAPIVKTGAVTYLHSPNGKAIKLNLNENKTKESFEDIYNDWVGNKVKDDKVKTVKKPRIFNVNHNSCDDTSDVFAEEEAKMESNDFMIGPLQAEDHGNWVLSTYYEDEDGQWVEIFQVITIEIVENVPLIPEKTWFDQGQTIVLSFAYPFLDMQSCQIEPPRSTFDRYYERNLANSNKCEFVMKNATLQDQGTWTIIGVGRIVYKGSAFLRIRGIVK